LVLAKASTPSSDTLQPSGASAAVAAESTPAIAATEGANFNPSRDSGQNEMEQAARDFAGATASS
jgi:hypothetical protein